MSNNTLDTENSILAASTTTSMKAPRKNNYANSKDQFTLRTSILEMRPGTNFSLDVGVTSMMRIAVSGTTHSTNAEVAMRQQVNSTAKNSDTNSFVLMRTRTTALPEVS